MSRRKTDPDAWHSYDEVAHYLINGNISPWFMSLHVKHDSVTNLWTWHVTDGSVTRVASGSSDTKLTARRDAAVACAAYLAALSAPAVSS